MIVFVNGRFVPSEEATVSVFDRSFLYGDGLFETVRVYFGLPFLWGAHVDRLHRGAELLGLNLPLDDGPLLDAALQLIRRNKLSDAILRVTVSRGVGPRGYSPRGADAPLVVITLHEAPALEEIQPTMWRLRTARLRVAAGDPLAACKTTSKLVQVLARQEAEEHEADEAVILNTDGHIAEAASSNLFWLSGTEARTPPLAAGILPGVTRAFVRELCERLGWSGVEQMVPPVELMRADAVFLTLSTLGVVEGLSLDGQPLPRSPRVRELQRAYVKAVRDELGRRFCR